MNSPSLVPSDVQGVPAPLPTRICPIDLHALPPVPAAGAEEIARAVRRARNAGELWRARPLAERVKPMRRAAKAMLARRDEAMKLAREEMGTLEIEGLFLEALGPLDVLNSWVGVVSRYGQRQSVRLNPLAFAGKRAFVDLVPRGVVGVIAPWNFPVAGLYRSVYPALLTGNGLVLKPSSSTPRTSQWFIDVLAEQLPDGLAMVVHGDRRVAQALIAAGVDSCVFTGSPEGGREVSRLCAERGIPSSIEAGGKDPAIVLSDCDLERTCAGITHWALSNVGQSCGAVEIAFVEDAIADRFVAALGAAWKRLRVGPGKFAEIGPLANRRQFDVVVSQVEEAKKLGATVVCGGAPTGTGFFYPPTLLDHCTDEMAVVKDETFGPVLAVVRVQSAAEAVRRTNAARYGLGASIWTGDLARAERLAEQLEVGVVDVNNHSFTGAISALPWSGTKETGYGVANSQHALLTYVRPKSVVVDTSTGPEFFWMPFDRALWEAGNLVCDAQRGKFWGAWRLPLLMSARVRRIREFFRVGEPKGFFARLAASLKAFFGS